LPINYQKINDHGICLFPDLFNPTHLHPLI
jgi:hypothetical protein